jgi:transcription termination factor NusB
MNDFIDRLIDEKQQLDEKIEKLTTFIHSENFKTIEYVQQSLLQIQLLSMETYSQCLTERLVWLSPQSAA